MMAAEGRKKIAVIGAGISGLSCAHLLAESHHVEVFEAGPTLGGHTATKTVATPQGQYDVDTGFIVFNDRTYPHFLKLLAKLKVDYQKTSMGFSVTNEATGYEYAGTSLNGLFAQRRNLVNPRHWRLLGEILRFNKLCIRLHEQGAIPATSLGE
ncbi:MAG TPA: FAD-dependent oxidoreductase, partial [Cellvibrio sp.]|nr:FAD-dependent oxidoreductase [Cellvibrio sp.]